MANMVNSNTSQRFIAIQTGVSNVTGNGTVYQTVYSSLTQGSGFVIASGVFTCTVPGTFLFCAIPSVTSLNSSATTAVFNLVTTQRTYTFANFNAGALRSQASVGTMGGYVIAPMAANDTAKLTVQVSGTTLSIGFGNGCTFQATRLF